MNSFHEEGVRDRNRAGVEADDPARIANRDRHDVMKTNGKDSSKLNSGREHPPIDMSSSENVPCSGGIVMKPLIAFDVPPQQPSPNKTTPNPYPSMKLIPNHKWIPQQHRTPV
eukprot:gene24853-biopygen2191